MFLFLTKRPYLKNNNKKRKDVSLNVFRKLSGQTDDFLLMPRTVLYCFFINPLLFGCCFKHVHENISVTAIILTESKLGMYIIEALAFCTASGINSQLAVGKPSESNSQG